MINLTKREKTLLRVLAVVIIIAVIYLVAAGLVSYLGSSEDEMGDNIDKISKLDRIHQDYVEIQDKIEAYKRQLSKSDNITSLVEQWSTSAGIAGNIAYTRRSQSKVQNKYTRITTNVKFEGVSIEPFLKFLYDVENSGELLNVSYLRLNPALKGTSTYDIDLKIDSFTSE
ncbi:MAG: type II secretion system protein M [Spirochaetes bacterium]|jgi:Tfp pilus assembly protein PilO|nr:type II secretion system protein M [Spirochaetota bacterium]